MVELVDTTDSKSVAINGVGVRVSLAPPLLNICGYSSTGRASGFQPEGGGSNPPTRSIGEWRSLAAHLVWDQRVAGSNPAFPTTCLEVTCL